MCYCMNCLDVMYMLRAYGRYQEESLISFTRALRIPLQHLIPLLIKIVMVFLYTVVNYFVQASPSLVCASPLKGDTAPEL